MPLNKGYSTKKKKTSLWHQNWATIPCIHPNWWNELMYAPNSVLISFQQNGVNFSFREAINTWLISLHRFLNNIFSTCPNHNIMKILRCSINKKLSSHNFFNCIHLSLHLFVHYDGGWLSLFTSKPLWNVCGRNTLLL
jgi:hypothetical protein